MKEAILKDQSFSEELNSRVTINSVLLSDHKYLIQKYLELLRKDEYFTNHKKWYEILTLFFIKKRRNILGAKLGILIPINTCNVGLHIWHYGSIIINGHVKIGTNCQFHGDNCIGNKGDERVEAPVIGDNVDIGVGAKIIGNVYIANNIKVGANAVVTKSFYEEGITIAGIPAVKFK